ncbi:MAG: ABC transporter permease [Thermoanaerobaculia bacterium]|nr:ABC transporter permease [Thermoanaerobaculia bacterium]
MSGTLRLRGRILVAALRRGGARTLLAVAAVALAVAAAALHGAVRAGAERELAAVASAVGSNLFVVTAGQVLALPGRGRGWLTSSRLDSDDAAALADRVPSLAAVVPMLEGSRRVVVGGASTSTTVRGVPPEYLALRRLELAAGRPLDAADERERRRVALLGATVAVRLGGDLVGRVVRVGGVPFEVVGELATKGLSPDGQNEDDQILIPLETARRRLFNRESLSRLLLQATDAGTMSAAQRETRALLRERHRIATDARDDFEIAALVRSNEIRRRGSGFVTGMAAIFAATTALLATAGVTAVSYLNVRDRAAEIGLRMAVGARRRDVAREIVAESCVLALTGGVVGVAAGLGAVAVLERTLGWRMAIEPSGVALSFALAAALGLVAGWLPARRAARLAPVEALRSS